jgi:hypothetical protein
MSADRVVSSRTTRPFPVTVTVLSPGGSTSIVRPEAVTCSPGARTSAVRVSSASSTTYSSGCAVRVKVVEPSSSE